MRFTTTTKLKIMHPLLCFCTVFILILFSFCPVRAQTKLIAHKSHSGSGATFKTAYEAGFVSLNNSNFGRAPERTVETSSLDSLIFISDTVAVMVTSTYCNKNRGLQQKTTRWKAGKDTVYHHPLFTKKHSVAYIKSYLKQYYYFQNPVDSIRFIDAEEPIEEHYETAAVVTGNDDNGEPGAGSYLVLSLLVFVSLLVGGIYQMFLRLQKI